MVEIRLNTTRKRAHLFAEGLRIYIVSTFPIKWITCSMKIDTVTRIKQTEATAHVGVLSNVRIPSVIDVFLRISWPSMRFWYAWKSLWLMIIYADVCVFVEEILLRWQN